MSVIRATAPSHWAPYLCNGDASGMEDDEIAQADAFHDWLCGDEGVIVDCEDAGFRWNHDARQWALAADCQTYVAFLYETTSQG